MSPGTDRPQQLRAMFAAYSSTRNPALREQLVAAHLGLAEYLARRFANRGEALDDLVKVASLGLAKAVDHFDPAHGVEFPTYATRTIVGELKRHFRDKGWPPRAPRRVQELHLRLSEVIGALSQELGRSPTISELAAKVKVSEEEVLEALEAGQAYQFASPDERSDNEPDETLGASPADNGTPLSQLEGRTVLPPMLARLAPREQLILRMRFFDGLSQSEIAERFGISQVQVSRILARGVARLRLAAGTA
ncbi:MAG: SigB/SigF/SigG family RNA polymerase sigma factor [Acidimicrobiales bacterium]